MNTTTLGYILIVTLPLIIILTIKLRNKKNKEGPYGGLTDDQLGNALKQGIILKELVEVETTLEAYITFLETRLPIIIPEVATEITLIRKRRRFVRNIRVMVQDQDPQQEISEDRWSEILKTCSYLSQLPTLSEMNLSSTQIQRMNDQADEEIDSLINEGYLPEEVRNQSRTISPEELEKFRKEQKNP